MGFGNEWRKSLLNNQRSYLGVLSVQIILYSANIEYVYDFSINILTSWCCLGLGPGRGIGLGGGIGLAGFVLG